MKVLREKLNTPPLFTPFRIILDVESREEAQALYAIFNFTHNTNLIDDDCVEDIRQAIGREHYVGDGEIANGVSYGQYYSRNKGAV